MDNFIVRQVGVGKLPVLLNKDIAPRVFHELFLVSKFNNNKIYWF